MKVGDIVIEKEGSKMKVVKVENGSVTVRSPFSIPEGYGPSSSLRMYYESALEVVKPVVNEVITGHVHYAYPGTKTTETNITVDGVNIYKVSTPDGYYRYVKAETEDHARVLFAKRTGRSFSDAKATIWTILSIEIPVSEVGKYLP